MSTSRRARSPAEVLKVNARFTFLMCGGPISSFPHLTPFDISFLGGCCNLLANGRRAVQLRVKFCLSFVVCAGGKHMVLSPRDVTNPSYFPVSVSSESLLTCVCAKRALRCVS